jgi:hypothetical protein
VEKVSEKFSSKDILKIRSYTKSQQREYINTSFEKARWNINKLAEEKPTTYWKDQKPPYHQHQYNLLCPFSSLSPLATYGFLLFPEKEAKSVALRGSL